MYMNSGFFCAATAEITRSARRANTCAEYLCIGQLLPPGGHHGPPQRAES